LTRADVATLLRTEGQIRRDDEAVLGTVAVNYYKDVDGTRKRAVRDFLTRRLQNTIGEGREAAEKSLELAEKLATATFETSAFNRMAMAGNDQLAECFGFQGWRVARIPKGRKAGPRVHLYMIESLGTTFLRTARRDTDLRMDVKDPLFADQIDFDAIYPDGWLTYASVFAYQYHELKKEFLNRSPDAEKMGDIDYWRGLTGLFDRADPIPHDRQGVDVCGSQALKVKLVLGIVDLALNEKSGWTSSDFGKLEKVLTREKIDGQRPFLGPKQWRWIKKFVDFNKKLAANQRGRVLRDGLGAGSGGGKRR